MEETFGQAADALRAVSWAAWGTTQERTYELRLIDYYDISSWISTMSTSSRRAVSICFSCGASSRAPFSLGPSSLVHPSQLTFQRPQVRSRKGASPASRPPAPLPAGRGSSCPALRHPRHRRHRRKHGGEAASSKSRDLGRTPCVPLLALFVN